MMNIRWIGKFPSWNNWGIVYDEMENISNRLEIHWRDGDWSIVDGNQLESNSSMYSEPYPIGSMYGIYGNIYHQYTPNVSIYTIHGSYGCDWSPSDSISHFAHRSWEFLKPKKRRVGPTVCSSPTRRRADRNGCRRCRSNQKSWDFTIGSCGKP